MSARSGGDTVGESRRTLGAVEGDRPGATLLATAAIHGNEPAGIEAARRVLARLEPAARGLRGRLVVVVGNARALERRARFVDLDLNRQWTPEKVDALVARPGGAREAAEHAEQRALLDVLRAEIAAARGPVFFLDMHTSSADGPPFLTVGDTLINRVFSAHFPLPVILGLEEQVDGSLLEFLSGCGLVTLGVEAGRHDAPESADRLEAVLWVALVATGLLDAAEAPDLDRHRRRLEQDSRGIPRVIEVRRRHQVAPGDGFRMLPGFVNFQAVRRGQPLAHDAGGEIACPEEGRILLPLYQGLGEDGFFVARAVRPFWLAVSARVRRLGLGRLLPLLPGVRRRSEREGVLEVDTRIARVYPLDVFHLLGYRKLRLVGPHLVVSRRRHDLRRPPRVDFPW